MLKPQQIPLRLLASAALITFMLQAAQAQFVPPGIEPISTEKLADNLYAFRWGAYRSIFMVTAAGVIVTDPISPEAATEYRKAIAQITDKPVKYVVYSHAHWDHARGGSIFKDEGATFISQQRCIRNFNDSPNTDIVAPDITFDKSYSVELGGQALELYYFGPSHGTCLIVMIPSPHKMIYTVDIMTPRPAGGGYLPWDPQVADFHFYNAVEYLQALEALVDEKNISTVIGAHLVPLPQGKGTFFAASSTGPIIQITERREFWEKLMQAVKSEMDSGTESFMVSAKLDKTPWENIRGYNKRKFKQLVDRIAAYYAIGK
ncbi:MAG: MBL fold metallo-hydrolase [Gammaproteobacteria bacterium]|nr:MBL fold metallo-hydrolase [Gammaproteobacteria bacterium]MCP4276198.1 MBL fold metallo-hydrolase [Gammaproteobacteria bacterium]MCP4832895.1 MBL fold metallo-hydrolase [Gammaproteobacteria bacterium]